MNKVHRSDVILQTFSWNSWKTNNRSYFKYLSSQSEYIKKAGIDAVWLPPCTKSVTPQGYMPLDLYDFDSEYGSKEALLECIDVFKNKDIDVYADVVLSHRCACRPNERGVYNVFGGKLAWDTTAIVGNDTKFEGKGNIRVQDLFDGAPNIDHSNDFVRKDLIEWMNSLVHMGFDGFRFDFIKGMDPTHMKEYFEKVSMRMSIVEYWDDMAYTANNELEYNQNSHRQRIVDWIDKSGQQSTAFDITTKGILQEALTNKEYWRLADVDNKPPGVIGWWSEKSVTFIDNHDTHRTSQNYWPFPTKHLVQGYAYILTHPGIPMVFWDDFNKHGLHSAIVYFIQIRKRYGINSGSKIDIKEASTERYTAVIDERLKITIGEYDFGENIENTLFKLNNQLLICEI